MKKFIRKLIGLTLLMGCNPAFADTPPQVINKLCTANQFFSRIQPGPGNIQCTQPTYSGISNTPTFADSLSYAANVVTLVNDSLTPGNSKYYGTNASGVRGFFDSTSLGAFLKQDGTTPLTSNWDAGAFSGTFNGVDIGLSAGKIDAASGSLILSTGGFAAITISSGQVLNLGRSGSGAAQIMSGDTFTLNTSGTGTPSVFMGRGGQETSISLGNGSQTGNAHIDINNNASGTDSYLRYAINSGAIFYSSGVKKSDGKWHLTGTSDLSASDLQVVDSSGNLVVTGSLSASNFSGSSSGTNTGNVTIGTANGLSLAGQVLSLQLATTSLTGALSFTDWNTFNNKQTSGNYITALTTDVSATGPGSVAATIQPNVVSNSKLAQMSANTIKGNNTGSTANAADLTVSQINNLLGVILANGTVPLTASWTTSNAIVLPDGTVSLPSLGVGSTTTGLYRPNSTNLGTVVNAIEMMRVDVNGAVDLGYASDGPYNNSTSQQAFNFHGQTFRTVTASTSGVGVAALNRQTSSGTANAFLKAEVESTGGAAFLFLSRNATGYNWVHDTDGDLKLYEGASGNGGTVRLRLDSISKAWYIGTPTTSITHQVIGSLNASANFTAANLSGTNTGDISLAAVGSSANANAASLSGQILNLQPFSSSFPGVVLASGGGSSNFLRADGTWAAPAGTAGITALTGDVTATGPGSVAATLATVATGATVGSSTSIPTFTFNNKGLVTSASGNAVIAPAGTLSGTILNATVVSSSLTSVGTIGTGVWQGTAIADGFIATSYIKADGTRALTGNWNVGAFTLVTTAATGMTSPIFTASASGTAANYSAFQSSSFLTLRGGTNGTKIVLTDNSSALTVSDVDGHSAFVNGSVGAPAIVGTDADSGILFGGTNDVYVSTNASTAFQFLSTKNVFSKQLRSGVSGSFSSPDITHDSDSNTGIVWGQADDIYFATGGANRLSVDSGGIVGVETGDLKVKTAGKGLFIKEGSNAKMGTCTLSIGTCTVSTTAVTASSRIFITVQSLGTVAVATPVSVTARSAGTSFTISSSSATDTSVVAWVLFEPA